MNEDHPAPTQSPSPDQAPTPTHPSPNGASSPQLSTDNEAIDDPPPANQLQHNPRGFFADHAVLLESTRCPQCDVLGYVYQGPILSTCAASRVFFIPNSWVNNHYQTYVCRSCDYQWSEKKRVCSVM
eukprot:TRINITY_DN3400_c0_g3_i1.p1 TRINITY_DN3400_c0_g3~~TRINITY_DN3400_c0_g3_i1.p1  ORF type:complete len:127 (+),score=7.23 TRINITY_DN3400_c0_g3_i1:113-493(+)